MVFFLAAGTLDEEDMACIISTVGMMIRWDAALMAGCNHIVGNPLTQALIKDKVFT